MLVHQGEPCALNQAAQDSGPWPAARCIRPASPNSSLRHVCALTRSGPRGRPRSVPRCRPVQRVAGSDRFISPARSRVCPARLGADPGLDGGPRAGDGHAPPLWRTVITAVYVDSSAIVKLAVREPESDALRRFLRRRRRRVWSALARVEVERALRPEGHPTLEAGRPVLARCDFVRVNDRMLSIAGLLPPAELRPLDPIHLGTAERLRDDVGALVAYDTRMADAARELGHRRHPAVAVTHPPSRTAALLAVLCAGCRRQSQTLTTPRSLSTR